MIKCTISRHKYSERRYGLIMDYLRKKDIPFAVGMNSFKEDCLTFNLTDKQFCKLYKKYGEEIGTIML